MEDKLWSYRAALMRVIDADTLDLFVDLGFETFTTIRARLLGVDAPEIRGPEKLEGQAATDWVIDWIVAAQAKSPTNRNGDRSQYCFRIVTRLDDSFGRWLCDIYDHDDRHLNQDLLDAGHASPYRR